MAPTRLCVIGITLYMLSTSLHAYVTGADLAELCGAMRTRATNDVACMSYISGAVDRAGWELLLKNTDLAVPKQGESPIAEALRRKMLFVYCPPDNAQPQQTAALVRKFLADNPSKWHLPAAHLLVMALEDAFPC